MARATGRTRSPRCIVCGGASKPGHWSTDKHRKAEYDRTHRLAELTGPAHVNRRGPNGSRAEEERVWAEEEARDRLDPRSAIDWLIDSGALPPEPTMAYDGSMAEITLREAARRLEVRPDTLKHAIHRGKMLGRKVGRDWLVEESEVRTYELMSLGRVGWPKGRPRRKIA